MKMVTIDSPVYGGVDLMREYRPELYNVYRNIVSGNLIIFKNTSHMWKNEGIPNPLLKSISRQLDNKYVLVAKQSEKYLAKDFNYPHLDMGVGNDVGYGKGCGLFHKILLRIQKIVDDLVENKERKMASHIKKMRMH